MLISKLVVFVVAAVSLGIIYWTVVWLSASEEEVFSTFSMQDREIESSYIALRIDSYEPQSSGWQRFVYSKPGESWDCVANVSAFKTRPSGRGYHGISLSSKLYNKAAHAYPPGTTFVFSCFEISQFSDKSCPARDYIANGFHNYLQKELETK